MKKILMAGALVASMLASSAAFAADLTVGVSEDKLTVTADTDAIMTANAGKQMTVVVVDGDGTTVSTDTIRYIDQDEAKAGLFESMGVLLRATKEVDAEGNPIMETALPVGTYTVKIGGEDITDLYVGTLTIAADVQESTVKFTVGDVNKADGVTGTDADLILAWMVGGDAAVGGDYEINETITTTTGTVVFGDVNGADGVTGTDADLILAWMVGGDAAVGGAADINAEATLTVPAN